MYVGVGGGRKKRAQRGIYREKKIQRDRDIRMNGDREKE